MRRQGYGTGRWVVLTRRLIGMTTTAGISSFSNRQGEARAKKNIRSLKTARDSGNAIWFTSKNRPAGTSATLVDASGKPAPRDRRAS